MLHNMSHVELARGHKKDQWNCGGKPQTQVSHCGIFHPDQLKLTVSAHHHAPSVESWGWVEATLGNGVEACTIKSAEEIQRRQRLCTKLQVLRVTLLARARSGSAWAHAPLMEKKSLAYMWPIVLCIWWDAVSPLRGSPHSRSRSCRGAPSHSLTIL
jgi:hypothetical protein